MAFCEVLVEAERAVETDRILLRRRDFVHRDEIGRQRSDSHRWLRFESPIRLECIVDVTGFLQSPSEPKEYRGTLAGLRTR